MTSGEAAHHERYPASGGAPNQFGLPPGGRSGGGQSDPMYGSLLALPYGLIAYGFAVVTDYGYYPHVHRPGNANRCADRWL
jgi:hypothetical protein